jgi:hypothetical protein
MLGILATQEAEIRSFTFQNWPGQIVQETLSQKNPSQKRADGVALVVEHLPHKFKHTQKKFLQTSLQKRYQVALQFKY